MVTHSSIHAWRIPWTEKPGGLQSISPLISLANIVLDNSLALDHLLAERGGICEILLLLAAPE